MDLEGNLSDYALFLDLDGTLIDIAGTPDGVSIPEDLVKLLDQVQLRLGGAFAILTGRPIGHVDRLLAPMTPVAAGVHGAELRSLPNGTIICKAAPINDGIVRAVHDVAERHAGAIVEMKSASIAVHYRQAPALASQLEAALKQILNDCPNGLILARGRQVLEIVPRDVSKGAALEEIMSLPTFAGRRPIMIGDDLPDLSALEAAIRLGGRGLKVAGEQFTRADADFYCPADVRAWLVSMTHGLTT